MNNPPSLLEILIICGIFQVLLGFVLEIVGLGFRLEKN